MKTKAYVGTFVKKTGEKRTLKFAKLDDLPSGFLPTTKGGTNTLKEGMELVWDLENNAYRVFNHTTLVGTLEEFDFTIPTA